MRCGSDAQRQVGENKAAKPRKSSMTNIHKKGVTFRAISASGGVFKHPGDLFTHGNDMPGGPVQHD